MNEWLLISAATVAILVVIGLILTMVFLKKKKEGKLGEPNYKAFYMMGIIWIPIGVVFMITIYPLGIAFLGLGCAYVAIGLANKDKWEKND